MTANNILLHHLAGYLYADAAVYSSSEWGRILRFESKLFPLPAAKAVMAARGRTFGLKELAARLGEAQEFDSLINLLNAVVPLHRAAMIEAIGTAEQSLAFVVHRPGKTPASLTVDVDGAIGIAVDWIRIMEGPAAALHPPLEGEDLAAVMAVASNPVLFGEAAIDRQRELKLAKGMDRPAHIVGGFAEMAIVTADGVEIHRLRTWPDDKIGTFIDPHAAGAIAGRYSDELVVGSLAIDNSAPGAPTVLLSLYIDPFPPNEDSLIRVTVHGSSLNPVRATFEYTADDGANWAPYTPFSGPLNSIRPAGNVFDTRVPIGDGKGFRVTLYSSNGTPGATGQAIWDSTP